MAKKATGNSTSKRVVNGAVATIRDEVNRLLPIYYMIRDCIIGEPAIKGTIDTTQAFISFNPASYNGGGSSDIINISRARRYLPMPNEQDQALANQARYRSYVQRAVYYNATSRTLDGHVGQVYLTEPVVKIPAALEVMVDNADGQGLTLTQVSKRAVRDTLSFGRAGLLVDYPKTDGVVTKQQQSDGDIQPVLTVFSPWNIVNWQTVKRGAKTLLSLVVLREVANDLADDGFQVMPYEQYRVLRLDAATGNYTVEVHKPEGIDNEELSTPVDSNGKPFTEIPFYFIGSENNDDAVDKPPLYDLASLNIAHYRNSADYEEACFMVGQPTVAAIGLTEEWVKNVLGGVLTLGSRGGIPLPVGANIQLLQAAPNQLVQSAMEQKERQMVALGAKLVQQVKVQRTATESRQETSAESSTLANVAKNVSAAITSALQIAGRFVGTPVNDTAISFELNTQFELSRMTADDQSKLIAAWQRGAICFEEMRDGLRRAGTAFMDDDKAKKLIAEEKALDIATGPVVDPFNNDAPLTPPNPNPNTDPAAHSDAPATRGA